MALLQTFLLLGLDALLCTAEVKPGQKRVRFQCEQDPTLRLEWDLAPPPGFRSGRCAPARFMSERSRHPSEPARQAPVVSPFGSVSGFAPRGACASDNRQSSRPPAMGAQRIRRRIRLWRSLLASGCDSMRRAEKHFREKTGARNRPEATFPTRLPPQVGFAQEITKRRGRDSNPRSDCSDTGFRDRPNRPLWHLSGVAANDYRGGGRPREVGLRRSPREGNGRLLRALL